MSSVQPLVSPTRQASSGAEPVLQTLALTKTYRMGEVDVHALRGVDLVLHEGEFMALLGVSGSGKSTLLNILGGLDVPTSGRVYYRGGELRHGFSRSIKRCRWGRRSTALGTCWSRRPSPSISWCLGRPID
jgi:putative ABC transport system ATP-binding protein